MQEVESSIRISFKDHKRVENHPRHNSKQPYSSENSSNDNTANKRRRENNNSYSTVNEPVEPADPLEFKHESHNRRQEYIPRDRDRDREYRGYGRYNKRYNDYDEDHSFHKYNYRGNRGYGRHHHYDGDNNERDRQNDDDWVHKEMSKKKLWVGGLPSSVTAGELKSYFEAYGSVLAVSISQKGSAFVKFSQEEHTLHAYRQCKVAYIRDYKIKVKFAFKKPKLTSNRVLYVSNVPQTATKTELRNEFEKYGELEEVQMFRNPHVYCFLTYVSVDSAIAARKFLKNKYFIQFGKVDKDDSEGVWDRQDRDEAKPEKIVNLASCEVTDVLEPLSEEHTCELAQRLNSLQPTTASIRERRDWIFKHGGSMNDILLHMSVMLVAKYNDFSLRLSMLFLIHDILSFCTQRRPSIEKLDTVCELTLPHLRRVINRFRVESEQEKDSVLQILSLWDKHQVFPAWEVLELRKKFIAGEQQSNEDEF